MEGNGGMQKVIFILLFAFFITGCEQQSAVSYIDTLEDAQQTADNINKHNENFYNANMEGLVGVACQKSTDCLVPGSYAIQSNCPYQAYCENGSCVVGCPMYFESLEEEQIKYGKQCDQNQECECATQRPVNSYLRCVCLDDQCVAVVVE